MTVDDLVNKMAEVGTTETASTLTAAEKKALMMRNLQVGLLFTLLPM
jgi:hypothetical protein